MSNRLRAQLGSLTLLLLLAAVALVTTELYGPDGSSEPQTADIAGPGGRVVRSETVRTLCYQGVGGQVFAGAYRTSLEQAVDKLEAQLAGHRRPTVEVSIGCPGPAAADARHRYSKTHTKVSGVIGPVIEKPSAYEIHLYIVELDLYEDWLGDHPWVITTEEMFCGSPRTHACGGVTQGIYVTPSATSDTLYRSIVDAYGIDWVLDERP